jgi:hypothetical protein
MRSTVNALATLRLGKPLVINTHLLNKTLDYWITELVMILSKFSDQVLRHPRAIYTTSTHSVLKIHHYAVCYHAGTTLPLSLFRMSHTHYRMIP